MPILITKDNLFVSRMGKVYPLKELITHIIYEIKINENDPKNPKLKNKSPSPTWCMFDPINQGLIISACRAQQIDLAISCFDIFLTIQSRFSSPYDKSSFNLNNFEKDCAWGEKGYIQKFQLEDITLGYFDPVMKIRDYKYKINGADVSFSSKEKLLSNEFFCSSAQKIQHNDKSIVAYSLKNCTHFSQLSITKISKNNFKIALTPVNHTWEIEVIEAAAENIEDILSETVNRICRLEKNPALFFPYPYHIDFSTMIPSDEREVILFRGRGQTEKTPVESVASPMLPVDIENDNIVNTEHEHKVRDENTIPFVYSWAYLNPPQPSHGSWDDVLNHEPAPVPIPKKVIDDDGFTRKKSAKEIAEAKAQQRPFWLRQT